MQIDDVKNLILHILPGAELHLKGEDCNFSLDIISSLFAGLTTLNRQKIVLGAVKEQIQSGEIHALSVKAYTPKEWAKHVESAKQAEAARPPGELKVL